MDASMPPLVLAGARGWKWRLIREAIQRCGLKIGRDVFLPGPIDESRLPALYCGATMFVLPSLEEGFGLTLLEAMSCGAPCAISAAEALVELAGGAAHGAGDFSPEALAAAMRAVLSSESRRHELAEAGKMRAREFTWERCARMTINVYKEAAECMNST
jgi:alpha-1,3-rhamnosyl/mannosyltransferase